MPEFAPILVSVYDRCEHLKRCVAALLRNPEAGDSVLYVTSDGPQKPEHIDAIEGVRAYIRSIKGFKSVKPLFREENWGMHKSGCDAIAGVLSAHGRLIRLEDDIICSAHFLQFMNDGLRIFEKDRKIFGLCGHTHPKFLPPAGYTNDIFLWNSFSPWGYATWRNRWDGFWTNTEKDREQAASSDVWNDLCKIRPRLQTQKEFVHKSAHNDARLSLHVYLSKQYCVFPVRTLTVCAGMDGSGAHCGLGWTYGKQSLVEGPVRITPNVEPSEKIAKRLYWAHYSFINHGLGKILRHMGLFDPLYRLYRKLFCKQIHL